MQRRTGLTARRVKLSQCENNCTKPQFCLVLCAYIDGFSFVDIYDELLSVLVGFKAEQLQSHAMKEFPEFTWTTVCELVDKCKEKYTPKAIATVIVRIVKKFGLSDEHINDKIENLQLRALGLSTKKTWFAYKLIGEHANAARTINMNETSVHEIAHIIGSNVRASVVALQFCFDEYESILISINRRRPVIVCLIKNYLLTINKFSNNVLLEAVARGLGFDTIEYCNLSGQHVQSLLRILDEKSRTANLDRAALKPTFKNGPRYNRHGLDFTTNEPMKQYLQEWLGDENSRPILSELNVLGTSKLRNNQTVRTKFTLKSSNVEYSLRDMATLGMISPNSIFFSMLNEQGVNEAEF